MKGSSNHAPARSHDGIATISNVSRDRHSKLSTASEPGSTTVKPGGVGWAASVVLARSPGCDATCACTGRATARSAAAPHIRDVQVIMSALLYQILVLPSKR